MSNVFNLDDIRAAADKKFASVDIQVGDTKVRLINALQLPEAKRDALLAAQKRASEEGASQVEVLKDCIRIVADTEGGAEALLEQVGDNLAVLVEIFATYNKDTEAGEA
jgi:hypothetical protein